MIYLIYGNQDVLIKKYTKKIAKQLLGGDLDDLNYTYLFFNPDSFEEIFEQLNSLGMSFGDHCYVLDNCDFLSKKDSKEKYFSDLLTYVSNLDESNHLIMICNSTKIETNNSIVKYIQENGKTIETKELSDAEWVKYIDNEFSKQNITIDSDAAIELKNRVNGNFLQFENELKKLKNYTNHVTLEDVKTIVNLPLNDNNFDLINYLIANKISDALKTYRDLATLGNYVPTIIAMLSTQFKFYDQILYLSRNEKMNNTEISNLLKCSDKRVYYCLKNITNLNNNSISNILLDLYSLDLKIKTSKIDPTYGFECFILNFGKYFAK